MPIGAAMAMQIGSTVVFVDPDGHVNGKVTDFDPVTELIEVEWEDMRGDTAVFFLKDLQPRLMREDFTCGCGLYVHPSRRNAQAIHIPDCQYAGEAIL